MKVGDRVEWSSQSGGVRTTKRGEIVAVVPAGKKARKYAPRYACSSIWDFGRPRDHESYLVKADGRGNRLYWPRVKHLKKLSVDPVARPDFPIEALKDLINMYIKILEPIVPINISASSRGIASPAATERQDNTPIFRIGTAEEDGSNLPMSWASELFDKIAKATGDHTAAPSEIRIDALRVVLRMIKDLEEKSETHP